MHCTPALQLKLRIARLQKNKSIKITSYKQPAMHKFSFKLIIVSLLVSSCAQGQSNKMDFETYDPVSTLVVPAHKLTKAKYPFIDVHNHQWNMGSGSLDGLVKDMDNLNMKVMVNLSGGYGNSLQKMADNVKSQYPNRFIIFANVNFDAVGLRAGRRKP